MSYVVKNTVTGEYLCGGQEVWRSKWGGINDARTFWRRGDATNAINVRAGRDGPRRSDYTVVEVVVREKYDLANPQHLPAPPSE